MDEPAAMRFYTSGEACAVLGVKLATLYSYVNRGILQSYRQNVGRQRLYSATQVDALLEIRPAVRDEPAIPLADSWATEH